MNRIDRISALLVQLQSRSVVKAAQMADRFGVSLRTIYRDIRTLSEAGVPICGDAGIGYSLIEGYRLPPLMFTKEEAMAFLTAEKLIKEFTDIQNSRFFHQGMDKVRAVMQNVDKDGLATLDTTIEVYRSRNAPDEHYPNLLQTLLNSVNDQKALEISYIDVKEQISHRMIEVVGVTYVYPFWYLGAWCHLRNAYRNFRLDRIINIAVSQVSHTKTHPPLSSIIQSDEISDLTEVIVQTNQVVATYSADYSRFLGLIAQHNLDDGRVEQRYMTYSLEAMARWVLSHIDSTTIVSPPELIERIRTIISKINLSPTQNND